MTSVLKSICIVYSTLIRHDFVIKLNFILNFFFFWNYTILRLLITYFTFTQFNKVFNFKIEENLWNKQFHVLVTRVFSDNLKFSKKILWWNGQWTKKYMYKMCDWWTVKTSFAHTDNQTNRLTFTIVVFTGFRWTSTRYLFLLFKNAMWYWTTSDDWLMADDRPERKITNISITKNGCIQMWWLCFGVNQNKRKRNTHKKYYVNTINQQLHELYVWFLFMYKMCNGLFYTSNFIKEIRSNVIRPIIMIVCNCYKNILQNKYSWWT